MSFAPVRTGAGTYSRFKRDVKGLTRPFGAKPLGPNIANTEGFCTHPGLPPKCFEWTQKGGPANLIEREKVSIFLSSVTTTACNTSGSDATRAREHSYERRRRTSVQPDTAQQRRAAGPGCRSQRGRKARAARARNRGRLLW